jgi:hypothetical protein
MEAAALKKLLSAVIARLLGRNRRLVKPPLKAEDTALLSAYRRLVIFYAVVSNEIEQVIEFYRTPAEAEAMLERVLRDEPEWRNLFYIEPIEFVTGGLN